MERRDQEIREMGMPNSMAYTPPPIIQESPVKLPLAPLLSTPRGNPLIPPRRGTSIFSPSQTLDQPYSNFPPPPAPQQVFSPPPSSPDPDPPPLSPHTTANASDSKNSLPQAAAGGGGSSASIKYRECLKNHAASMGGNVVDGCGDFMPSGDDGTPESLRCAACDCHRNFHRKEVDGAPQQYHPYNNSNAGGIATQQIQGQITYPMPPHHHRQRQKHPSHSVGAGSAPPAMVNFGGSGGCAAESSSEDLNMFQSGGSHATARQSSKKRFRTKFSQEQKDQMQEFASKIGWRIQKQVEQEVQQFCSEVGVKRQVFKVWMHNNKQALKKKPI